MSYTPALHYSLSTEKHRGGCVRGYFTEGPYTHHGPGVRKAARLRDEQSDISMASEMFLYFKIDKGHNNSWPKKDATMAFL